MGVADETVLVLSDIGIDDHGVLEPPDSGGSAGMVFGREGNDVLVNGRIRPTLEARAGAPQRWRIVNAAKSRYFLLDLDGEPFTRIGGDGGLAGVRPIEPTTLVLAPGERADVIVAPRRAPGREIIVRDDALQPRLRQRRVPRASRICCHRARRQPPLPGPRRVGAAGARRTIEPISTERRDAA